MGAITRITTTSSVNNVNNNIALLPYQLRDRKTGTALWDAVVVVWNRPATTRKTRVFDILTERSVCTALLPKIIPRPSLHSRPRCIILLYFQRKFTVVKDFHSGDGFDDKPVPIVVTPYSLVVSKSLFVIEFDRRTIASSDARFDKSYWSWSRTRLDWL